MSRSTACEYLLFGELVRKLTALWRNRISRYCSQPATGTYHAPDKPIPYPNPLFLIRFDVTHLATSTSLKPSNSCRSFSHFFFAILIFRMSHSRYSPWYYYANSIWWKANISHLLIMQFSPLFVTYVWQKCDESNEEKPRLRCCLYKLTETQKNALYY